MWLRKKAYNEAINALREAEAYADELEPKPGEQISKDRMERWGAAKQLVEILEDEVGRLARALASSSDKI